MRKQAFTIAALVLCAQAALASSPDLNVQLNLLESKVTGKAQPNLSLADRVAALEKVVHGQVRTGSLVKRVKDLADVTGGSTVQNFRPPELPKVDTSSTAATAATEPEPQAPKSTAPHPVATPRPSAAARAKSSKPLAATNGRPAPPAAGKTASAPNPLKAHVEDDIRLGMQHHNSGNLTAAKAAFRRALRADPKNVNAHFNMGVICEETGDLQRALAHYQAAAEGAPNDADIQEAVVAVQKKLGNTAGAVPGQYGSNAQPFADQSTAATASSFSYEQPQASQDPYAPAPTPAPDFRQAGYQSGPFYAGSPGTNNGTPLLQGQAQQADLAASANQNNLGINNAPFSGLGAAQQQAVPPLSASSGSLNSGANQNSHPGRRKFLQSAATAVGMSAISIGSGLVRSRTGFGGGGGLGVLHCPVCSWLNRF